MNKKGVIFAIVGAIGGLFVLAASVPFDQATGNLLSWLKQLGQQPYKSILFWLGLALILMAMIVYIRTLLARIERRIGQTALTRKALADHWAERARLEISVIANVSAGREPTDFPIAKDPENTRFRQLKDAVNTGDLKAADLHGDRANAMTAVTIYEFRQFARRTGKDYWEEVLARWEAKQPSPSGSRSSSMFADPEPGLTMAAWWAVMESAWGTYQRGNPPDTSTDQNVRIGTIMHMVATIVSDAAMVGSLTIKGRPAGEIEFEDIPKATWRLAAIVATPDMASIWKLEVIARSSVDPERIERVLSYDSIIVNFERFKSLFDAMAPDPK